MKYDICIVGSGAGAGPVAYELVNAGYSVIVLEKGEFYKEKDITKDEIAFCRRSIVTPKLKDEYHLIEDLEDGEWIATPTYKSGWDFWNGNIVGGSSNFMSGFFHRLHPKDFRLKSEFGEIEGANVEDWAISYEDLKPYYDKVERVIGVSGDKNYYEATKEHPISKYIDKASKKLGLNTIQTPRAILTKQKGDRNPCYYSNYCGSYGCHSGAKGSSRASLLQPILKKENFKIITGAFVYELEEKNKEVVKAKYIKNGDKKEIKAKIFVLASQAVESSRLLLNSKSKNFPNGLSNNHNQVGKNLLFSAGGIVTGEFDESTIPLKDLMVEGLFVNRTVKEFYFLDNHTKGGILEMLFEHANPIVKSNKQKWQGEKLLWGRELEKKIFDKLNKKKQLNIEIFNDWIPVDDCFVSVNNRYRDKYNSPVANIRIGSHPKNVEVGERLAKEAVKLLKTMGAKDINSSISPYPPQNLQAGGCRFGNNPKSSVLDKDCKSHEVKNLYITDGSFMPTGGSVPYTWTIYANSFRVADVIKMVIS